MASLKFFKLLKLLVLALLVMVSITAPVAAYAIKAGDTGIARILTFQAACPGVNGVYQVTSGGGANGCNAQMHLSNCAWSGGTCSCSAVVIATFGDNCPNIPLNGPIWR